MLAAMLKAEKNVQGARVLSANEDFGAAEPEKFELQKNPPGYIPPEVKQKKKRIRKKKDKQEECKEGEDENDME